MYAAAPVAIEGGRGKSSMTTSSHMSFSMSRFFHAFIEPCDDEPPEPCASTTARPMMRRSTSSSGGCCRYTGAPASKASLVSFFLASSFFTTSRTDEWTFLSAFVEDSPVGLGFRRLDWFLVSVFRTMIPHEHVTTHHTRLATDVSFERYSTGTASTGGGTPSEPARAKTQA